MVPALMSFSSAFGRFSRFGSAASRLSFDAHTAAQPEGSKFLAGWVPLGPADLGAATVPLAGTWLARCRVVTGPFFHRAYP